MTPELSRGTSSFVKRITFAGFTSRCARYLVFLCAGRRAWGYLSDRGKYRKSLRFSSIWKPCR